jgi:hypothetical protein
MGSDKWVIVYFLARVRDLLKPKCPDKWVFGLFEWCSWGFCCFGLLCVFTGRFMRDVSGLPHCPEMSGTPFALLQTQYLRRTETLTFQNQLWGGQTSYLVGTRGFFFAVDKSVGAYSWPLTFSSAKGNLSGAISAPPYITSWCAKGQLCFAFTLQRHTYCCGINIWCIMIVSQFYLLYR